MKNGTCSSERGGRERRRLLVRGIVQGVGFRPYVHQLAHRFGLAGFVQNTAAGVLIEIEGDRASVAEFLAAMPIEGPPLMRIDAVDDVAPIDAAVAIGWHVGFHILASEAAGDAFALVPADACVCAACLEEILDPANRRFGYAFTNCTHCGPRYSILEDVPYDRAKTTMRGFPMCADCQREYDDPTDRRFHAQPNACAVCGPQLELVRAQEPGAGEALNSHEILAAAAAALLDGRIVAWKGLGGFQLACDARNEAAVRALRQRKQRPEKPFAVMVADIAAAQELGEINAAELTLLTSPQRPIVLLERRAGGLQLAPEVCFGIPVAGVMLPSTPMHALLFAELARLHGSSVPLVMTSGNRSEEPIAIDNAEALESLAGIADLFVLHNRPIHTRVDDSVARVFQGVPMLLRRARGYAPEPLWLGSGDIEVLACGGEQKNSFCLTRKGWALMSQHLGDLENLETLTFFEETLERMQRLFHVRPRVVACDLHPGYLSTQFAQRWAREQGIEQVVRVQHHHAHIVACMAEHGLEGEVIGVAWDGTGYGLDGTIWGGEFLVAGRGEFTRVAHLRPVLLAGGDAAVREPWRVALAYLEDAFGELAPPPAWKPAVAPSRLKTVRAMLERRVNTVPTTSAGRLFDAVASLLGLRDEVAFEGQAAMLLEAHASQGKHAAYEFALTEEPHAPVAIDLRTMIRAMVEDRERGVPTPAIAARFHATMVEVIVRVCRETRRSSGLHRVCLGGGCFQNLMLLRGCVEQLRAEGFEVFWPQRLPANDGGLALGQAAIAQAKVFEAASTAGGRYLG